LIGAVVLVAGYFALNFLEKRLEESTAQFAVEGREFGKGADQRKCMDEGIRRSKSMGLLDFSGASTVSRFIDACLETSKATPNFCDGVPSFWSMKDNEWGAAQCRKAGIDPEKTGCIHAMKRQHEFCSKPF